MIHLCLEQGIVPATRALLRYLITAESEGCHQRGGVIVKGTSIGVPQENHSGVLLHIPRDIEKGIDTEEVKGTGPDIELETSLNGRVVIVKSVLIVDIPMDIDDPHHLLAKQILRHFHQNGTDLPLNLVRNHQCQLLLKMTLMDMS